MSSRQLGDLLTSRTSGPARSESQWSELVASAIRERVAAVLAQVVSERDDVPENARQELAGARYHTGACNLLLYRELARVLEPSGIHDGTTPPILLKGGALASTVYEDITLRPMSDLDLLIRRAELEAWKARLVRLGYEPVSPEMARGIAEAVHYQLAYRGGAGGDVVIELHWNLVAGNADWRAPDVDWFWRQSEPWPGIEELNCTGALQLTPLANVLYLSAHAMLQHGGARARLVWLYDIHQVVTRSADSIDWQDVIAKAGDFRWDAAVARALARCQELFGTVVPETIVDELGRGASVEASAHVQAKASVESSRAALVWREFLCLRATGRLRLLLAILFPTPAYMKWRYPNAHAVWPLAYLYRWGGVAREGIAHAFRVLTSALSFVFL